MGEIRNYYYDRELGLEVCHFQQIEHNFPVHFHEYYIIGAIEDDNFELPYEKKEILMNLIYNHGSYPLRAGNILLCNPFECHSCQHLGNGYYSYYNVAIKPETMRQTIKTIVGETGDLNFTKPVSQNQELQYLVREIYYAVKDKESFFCKEELLIAIVDNLLVQLSDAFKIEAKEIKEIIPIDYVCEYMENNFDKPLSLTSLSEYFGYSKYHLIRLFSNKKGVSPHCYMESIRIKNAKKFLISGLTPCAVAQKTGYYDQSHFSKAFKRIVGLTPKQFRQYNQ